LEDWTGLALEEKRWNFPQVIFSKEVVVREPKGFVGIDLNEDNVTLSLPNGEFVQIITHEKNIRTVYYRKGRNIQRKIKDKKREDLLKKYGDREKNRINDLYLSWPIKLLRLRIEVE